MIFQPHRIPNEPILEDCQRRRQHSSGIFFNYDLSGMSNIYFLDVLLVQMSNTNRLYKYKECSMRRLLTNIWWSSKFYVLSYEKFSALNLFIESWVSHLYLKHRVDFVQIILIFLQSFGCDLKNTLVSIVLKYVNSDCLTWKGGIFINLDKSFIL